MSEQTMSLVEKSSLKPDVSEFEVGDTVDVHCRILEGDKERIQIFNGLVIARAGSGTRAARCTLHRFHAPLYPTSRLARWPFRAVRSSARGSGPGGVLVCVSLTSHTGTHRWAWSGRTSPSRRS